jgi:pyruvate kinase
MHLRVVMTLGPASAEPSTIERLARTADRFRLNASHVLAKELVGWLEKLARIYEDMLEHRPVVIDLQGAKMRIGQVPTISELPPAVRLVHHSRKSSTAAIITVPHLELFEQVREGEELSLNDGKVRLRVERVATDEIQARVIKNGPLSSFKGINRVDHPVKRQEMSPGDLEAIAAADAYPFVQYAFSFVHAGEDAALMRTKTDRHLIAKIERPEALPNLRSIDASFDELWLCRGDLGVQAGLAQLGRLQGAFSREMKAFCHPAYLAGQVLEHMTRFGEPTRSEVVHLYDVEQSGWQGIVLSDETAVGKDPVAVAELIDLLRAGENRTASAPARP